MENIIKTKYEVDDTVWFMERNRIHKGKIQQVHITRRKYFSNGDDITNNISYSVTLEAPIETKKYLQRELFATKKEIIEDLSLD